MSVVRFIEPKAWTSYRRAGVGWGLALVLLGGGAGAEPRPSIVLAFDATSDAQKQAVAAIQAHMQGLPLEVVAAPVEPQRSLQLRLAESGALAVSREAFGTFYVDVAEDRSLLIFFTEAKGEATLIRRLPPNRQGLRVALEQAAIVVRSLVEALLEGGGVGIAPPAGQPPVPARPASPSSGGPSDGADIPLEPPEAETLAPADEAASRAKSPDGIGLGTARVGFGAGLAVTSFASEAPWQAGFTAGAHCLVVPTLYVGGRYTLLPALTIQRADAAFSVRRHPLELLVGYRESGRVALNAELGAVVDRATRTTVRAASPLGATSSEGRWMLAVGARGGFSWSPWAPVWASLRAGADFVLTPYSYATDSSQLASPRLVRPRMELEVSVWLW